MEAGFVQDYRNGRLALYGRWQRWAHGHETWAKFGAAFFLALLTGALAQITLYTPLTPVPFTMQVFGVVLMGGLLGRKWGAISASLYLALGVLGLPVFAGELNGFTGLDVLRFGVFNESLSAWYLVGFIAQAYIVGSVVDNQAERRSKALVVLGPLAAAGLVTFALLDAYYLSDYQALYGTSAFPNAWFALLSLGLLLVVAGTAWVALTNKARRERIELFFGNVAGLVVLYAVGALGFFVVWNTLQFGDITLGRVLTYSVLPFIPVDLAKILLAIGILTLLRPTDAELRRAQPSRPSTDV